MNKLVPVYFDKNTEKAYHTMSTQEIYEYLVTNPRRGLDSIDVLKRQKKFGKNMFSKYNFQSRVGNYVKNLVRCFMLILWLGAFLSFAFYIAQYFLNENADIVYLFVAIIVMLYIFLCATLTYNQGFGRKTILKTFQSMMPVYCTVIRDGRKRVILCADLVKGDIVMLQAGDHIPADVRILQSKDLTVDLMPMWGESIRHILNEGDINTNISENRTIAFASTIVVEGTGLGVVIAIGNESFIGRLCFYTCSQKVSTATYSGITDLTICIFTFLILCMITMISLEYENWEMPFEVMTGVTLGCVPITLSLCTHIGLMISARRLFEKNCYVQNLKAIETIGTTTVVCTDMYGTLTMNRLRVAKVYVNGELYDAAEIDMEHDKTFLALCRCAALCNKAVLNEGMLGLPEAYKEFTGEKHDVAILKFVSEFIDNIGYLRQAYRSVSHKQKDFNMSIHIMDSGIDSQSILVLMKGVRTQLLAKCKTMMVNGEITACTDEAVSQINQLADGFAEQGMRVFLFCEKIIENAPKNLSHDNEIFRNIPEDICFLGLITLYDPPLLTSISAVKKCHSAGIKVVLLTNAVTHVANAIAKQVGIISIVLESADIIAREKMVSIYDLNYKDAPSIVVDSSQLVGKTEEKKIENILLSFKDVVFANITQDQRFTVIGICQKLGAIVAVFGRNVHDAPSVRLADIGICKMMTGLPAFRHAADLILLDQSFVTVVTAIEEGRLFYENLRKLVAYILVLNVPLVAGYLSYPLLRIPQPLKPYSPLYVNLCLFLPSLTLFYEKAEEDLMKLKPRRFNFPLFSFRMLFVAYALVGVMVTAAAFLAYFIIMAKNGFFPWDLIDKEYDWSKQSVNDITDSYGQEWTYHQRKTLEAEASTAYIRTIIAIQAFYLIICKTKRANILKHGFGNNNLNIAFIIIILCVVLMDYLGIASYFYMSPLSDCWWIYALIFSVFLLIFETFRRALLRRFPNSWLECDTYY